MLPPSDIELDLLRGIVSPARREDAIARINATDSAALRGSRMRRLVVPFYLELSAEQRRKISPRHDLDMFVEVNRQWNAQLQGDAEAVIRALTDKGIEVIALKGVALQWLYGDRLGLRPRSDIDIAIRTNAVSSAIDVLTALGWEKAPSTLKASLEAERRFMHAAPFTRKDRNNVPGVTLDLHWHVLGQFPNSAVDQVFRANTQVVSANGLSVPVFIPTFQLIHTWVHGTGLSRPTKHFAWVLDTRVILRESTIDWEAVTGLARDFHLGLLFSDITRFLVDLGLEVPGKVVRELAAMRPSLVERLERKVQSRERYRKVLGDLPVFICHFSRLRYRAADKPRISEFTDYLRFRWGVPPDKGLGRTFLEVSARRLKRGGTR